MHITQQQLLASSLRALPGMLFGEYIGCAKRIAGKGGSFGDCAWVIAELAAPKVLGVVARTAKELRLAIAIGDVSTIDAALAGLRGTAIDRTALNGLEDAARAGRARAIEDELKACKSTSLAGSRAAVSALDEVPCKLFPNKYPNDLAEELETAERLGVTPTGVGTAAFDRMIDGEKIKWAVLKDGRLVIVPKIVGGEEIKHSVLSGGAPVRAAGEAMIAGSDGHYFGLEIDGQSGHFFEPGWDAEEIGRDFFAQAGIEFP